MVVRGMRSTPALSPWARRGMVTWLATATAAAVAGAALVRGDLESLLVLVAVVGAALAVLASRFGLPMLFGWILLAAPAYPWLRFPRTSALITFDRLWVPALLGAVVLGVRELPAGRLSRSLGWCAVWLGVAYGARAFTTSLDPASAAATWFDAIVLPTILGMAAYRLVRRTATVKAVMAALTVTGALLAAIGMVERVTGLELATLSGGKPRVDHALRLVRVSGPYNAPEVYALVLLVCLAATLCWMQSSKGRPLVYALGACATVAELAGITITFFRAAWIGAAMILVVMLGLRPGRRLRGAVVVAAVGGALLVIVAAFGHTPVLSERLENRENVYGRFAVYVQGLRIFQQSPLVGVGVGRFIDAQASTEGIEVAGVRQVDTPHSTFVSVLAELGVWGTLPLLAALIAAGLLVRAFRRRASDPLDVLLGNVTMAAGLAYLLMSLTLTMLPYGASNSPLALLLGVAAARLDVHEAGDAAPADPAPATVAS